MQQAQLSVQDVTVRYGDTLAVDGVSLDVAAGEAVAILGPSGCGKSTLLRVVAGLEPGYTGRVELAGRDLRGVPAHRRRFAMVFQDGQLFDHLSVGGNVVYGLTGRAWPRARRRDRVEELLGMVGLAGFAGRRPATLSGGERQRVALARGLAPAPEILLLDEPLSALDRSLRERLAADVRSVLTATGTTAILVTHDHDEALTIGDRVAVMRAGRVVQSGPGAEVWRHPVDEGVARFLGCSAVLRGGAATQVLRAAGLAVPDEAAVALRRSAFRVAPRGTFAGTVLRVSHATDALRLLVQVEGVGEVEALGEPGVPAAPGDAVRLGVDPAGLARLG